MKITVRTIFELIPLGVDDPSLIGRAFVVSPKVEKTSPENPYHSTERLPKFLAIGNCVKVAGDLSSAGVPVTWIGVNRKGNAIIESVEIVDANPKKPLA